MTSLARLAVIGVSAVALAAAGAAPAAASGGPEDCRAMIWFDGGIGGPMYVKGPDVVGCVEHVISHLAASGAA